MEVKITGKIPINADDSVQKSLSSFVSMIAFLNVMRFRRVTGPAGDAATKSMSELLRFNFTGIDSLKRSP